MQAAPHGFGYRPWMPAAATSPRAPQVRAAPPQGEGGLRWGSVAWFAGMHVACFAALAVGVSATALWVAGGLYVVRMFALTAGYHRLFAHRSYEATPFFRAAIATLGTTCMQAGPLWWASVHRRHHRMSDTEGDEHSPIAYSLWRSHIGWLFRPGSDTTDYDSVADLMKHRSLVLLDKWVWVPPTLLFALLFAVGAWLEAHHPELGTSGAQLLVWGGIISTVVLYHGTWTVNSLAHLWGSRPYATKDRSRNNALIAVWTLGEGWHNNHHRFPASERQGFRWWQLDVTHLLLRGLGFVGLVRRLRAPPPSILEEAGRR
jgi:stearoyl-CoA desaturase (delta-9 desaturase)